MTKKEQNEEEIDDRLSFKQEKFCQIYATNKEFFGNGGESYAEAYGLDRKKTGWYKVAQASASRLLSKVKICDRINQILTETGFNDNFVDKQLSFLLTQHADFTSKLGAIREYNKLKKRIEEKNNSVIQIINLPDEKYEQIVRREAELLKTSRTKEIDELLRNGK